MQKGENFGMKKNFKELMVKKRRFLGSWMGTACPEMVEVLGIAGFDFVIIDTEHTAYGMECVTDLIRAAEVVEIVPIVRVPETSAPYVKKALDAGAAGIIFPNIGTKEEALMAAQLCRYNPLGIRGACPCVRANKYGKGSFVEYYAKANEDVTVILLIETAEGYKNFDEILETPGVDVVYFGADDLSVSMGYKGDRYHPMVHTAIAEMLAKAKAKNFCAGVWSTDTQDAKNWLNLGADYIMFGNDVGFALQKASESVEAILSETNSHDKSNKF
jgi:4-hydroxy-2-oxoheptanedioate aldolase